MKVSKMVVDRERSARKVVASARTHEGLVRTGAVPLLGEGLADGAAELMSASADVLEHATLSLVTADEAHIAELGDDEAGRGEREGSRSEVRDICVDFRDVTTPVLGPKYVADLGYEGKTPEDPIQLHRLGVRILERIDKVPVPVSRYEGMTFDPAPWRDKLAAPVARLGTALDAVAKEDREAEQTITAKNQAIATYDEVFSKSAGLISALLRVAGQEALADRVRPVPSKPGQIADPEVEVEEPSVSV